MSELLETLSSYVPALIARRLAADPTPISAPTFDQFPAAALFADISGFTPLAERFARRGPAGVEELSRLLNDYFGRLISLVNAHGGDVAKFAGDGLLALWSAPAAGEDLATVALRATQCGLAVQEQLHDAEMVEGVRLSLRTGVGVGDTLSVCVGGNRGRWGFLLAGPSIVQMSTAAQEAQPGQMVLSAETWALVRQRATGQPLPSGAVLLSRVTGPLPLRPLSIPPLPPEAEPALRSYIPSAIRFRLAAGRARWLAELRRVTVLFVNLPGMGHSTSLEQAQAIMQALQQVIYHYEGGINKLSVDDKGVMLVAAMGLPPLSHEDDAARGAQAALAIQQELHQMGLRSAIGVATGRAFCGSIGSAARREYTMVGDVVNLAVRLMQAVDDDVLCDETTYEAAKGRLAFDILPSITVKGKAKPVPVYRPVRETAGADYLPSPQALVGRTAERMMLVERVRSLMEFGTGGVVVIEGEAGIGKSRLVDELRHYAETVGGRVLFGAGDSIEWATPYYAWRTIFRQVLNLDALPADPEVRRQHVLTQLASAPELLRLAPLLKAVLPLDFADNEITAQMTGQVRAENTQELLLRLLQKSVGTESEGRPCVLILEDAQWLDSASWALALLVSRRLNRTLLVIAMRPPTGSVPPEYTQLSQAPFTGWLRLDALSPQETQTLVAQRLGVASVPEAVETLIYERAQGNPFYSEELAYALRDAGLIIVSNGECRIAPQVLNLTTLSLPDTVQGVITSRIDRLEPSQQLTLKIASVIGRVFPFRALRDIHPIEEDRRGLIEDLVALQKLDLTPLETSQPWLSYVFRHIMTQEVAYNLMPFARRRQLHHAVATWYEHVYADDLSPYYPLLAHHWTMALDERNPDAMIASKAIDYLEKAGEKALRDYANREAAGFFSRALDLDERADLGNDPLRRARWERQMGQAYLGMGQVTESSNHLQQALVLLNRPEPTTQWRTMTGLVAQLLRQVWHRIRMPRAGAYGEQESARMLETARAYGLLSELHYFANETLVGLYSSLRTLNLAERAGPSPELARAYTNMCIAASIVSLHSLAEAYRRRARETAESIDNLPAQAWALMVSGLYGIGVGRWDDARQTIEQAVEMWNLLGDRHRWGESMGLLSWVVYYQGEFEQGKKLYGDIYHAARRSEDSQQQMWGLVGQAENILRLGGEGHVEEAVGLLEKMLPLFEEDVGRVEEIRGYGVLAQAYMRQGKPQRARWAADKAASLIAQTPPVVMGTFEGYAGAVETYLTLWEASTEPGARHALARASQQACRAFRRYARVFPVGQPRAWLLRGRRQWLMGHRGRARRMWRKGLSAAERLGMAYEQGLICYELGRHASGAERARYLTRAQEIMATLRAEYDLDRVRAALEEE